jgi:phage baseplate assembly protein W
MSKDIQLVHRCPHQTVEERVFLAADRRSLPVIQPVANALSVRVLVNNQVQIPSFGLFSQGQLYSAQSGPYRILLNENQFVIRSRTEVVTLDLPISSRVETSALVKQINTASQNILAENIRGYLVLTDTGSMGRESVVAVSGRAVPLLGFANQIRAVGRQVYPGWSLAQRADPTITNRFPRFLSQIKNNPVFKVTYTVPQQRCLRCGTSTIENDWRADSQGDTLMIENEDLLHQLALKILLTTKGTNPFHDWYGTQLRSRIGTKAIGIVGSLIEEDVRRALEAVQRLQVEQANFQAVSFKERIYTINDVRVIPHAQDPTTFLVDVFVSNASQEPINLSVIFTVPQVVTLMGSDGYFQ